MARRVIADSTFIVFPQSLTGPIPMNPGHINIVVNTTRVGWTVAGESRREDVELVQFYLSEFFDSVPISLPPSHLRSKTGEVIKIDGKMGGQTNSGILIYQKELLRLTRGTGIVTPPATGGAYALPGGQSVNVSSYSQARTILSLALFWNSFHPGMDILESDKLTNANHLRGAIRGNGLQPI